MSKFDPCAVNGCPKPARATIYCQMHYRRFRLYGDPNVVTRKQRRHFETSAYNIKNDCAEIIAANGEICLIDLDDLDKVKQYLWNVSTSTGYAYSAKAGTSMHGLIKGAGPIGKVIDHKNKNKLDNRKTNLEFVTYSQNNYNTVRSENSIGVGFHKASNKYRAYVTINSRQVHLGLFVNERDAVDIYSRAKNLARECKTRFEFTTKWKTMRVEKMDTEKRDE